MDEKASSGGEIMILLKGLSKAFSEKVILDNVDHRVQSGKVYCLTGGSGCGKTTLLRMIAGLEKPDSGEIEVQGKISYSFQEPRLFWQMDILSNVAVTSTQDRGAQLLDRLGLGDAMKKYPSEMSGGMRQRVSVARAIGYDADIYLFDEPTAALDQASAEICAEVILSELRGKTVLISTHSILLCEKADMLVRLENGKLSVI